MKTITVLLVLASLSACATSNPATQRDALIVQTVQAYFEACRTEPDPVACSTSNQEKVRAMLLAVVQRTVERINTLEQQAKRLPATTTSTHDFTDLDRMTRDNRDSMRDFMHDAESQAQRDSDWINNQ